MQTLLYDDDDDNDDNNNNTTCYHCYRFYFTLNTLKVYLINAIKRFISIF